MQLRMISLFDQDPEDLVAMLEDSVKNSSVEIFSIYPEEILY